MVNVAAKYAIHGIQFCIAKNLERKTCISAFFPRVHPISRGLKQGSMYGTLTYIYHKDQPNKVTWSISYGH